MAGTVAPHAPRADTLGGLAELFAAVAKRSPLAIALTHGDAQLTYAELDRRAEALARQLRGVVQAAEAPMAILLPRSVAMVVAVLAVLKAGGAYVPLDPGHPPARWGFQLADSGAALLLADPRAQASAIAAGLNLPPCFSLDPEGAVLAGPSGAAPSAAPLPRVGGEALAYLIYTSGSTGQPKAVACTQASVANLVLRPGPLAVRPADRVLQFAPLAFDASVFELFGPLLNGGRLVLAETGPETLDRLGEEIAHQEVTLAFLTTGLFRQLAMCTPGDFAPLRCLVVGGEALPPTAARQVLAACPSLELVNGYGPTETTVFALTCRVTPALAEAPSIPIGQALPGVVLEVLDPAGLPVPPGEPGELCIGGAGLARGYYAQPELTAARFPGLGTARRYRSGDQVRQRPDGALEFLGRQDAQVKLRGFRVEPGEVEAALRGLPEVADAVVLARLLGAELSLVAYVVPTGEAGSLAGLRQRLAATLPAPFVPAAIIPVASLPLTPNGKLDLGALPAPGAEAPTPHARSAREAQLCEAFAEVLGRPIGPDESFFEAGGDSLAALQLTLAVEQRCGEPVALQRLYAHPTPAALTLALAESAWHYTPLLPLRRTGTRLPLFCVHAAGGVGAVYRPLAMALPEDQPVWTLQARGLEANEPAHGSIAEMAEAYVAALREVQPRGPYHLLGWSLGGQIAHAMAERLEAADEAVGLLAMLDATLPAFSPEVPPQIGDLLSAIAGEIDPASRERPVSEMGPRLVLMRDWLGAQGLVPPATPAAWVDRVIQQLVASYVLIRQHEPGVTACAALLFRAMLETDHPEAFQWQPHCRGGLQVVPLPLLHGALHTSEAARLIVAALPTLPMANGH